MVSFVKLAEPKLIRLKFRKTGTLQFISHLDLSRTVKHAFLRAGVPIWYSEGFNPHPKVVFALPLSIGTESVCEFMDIKITSDMPLEQIKEKANATLTDELQIFEVYEPQSKFTTIGWSEYRITFDGENLPLQELKQMLHKPLLIMKRTKNGDKEADIQPAIKEVVLDKQTLTVVLCADNLNFLNPEYMIKVFDKNWTREYDYSIMRTNIYLADGITPFE